MAMGTVGTRLGDDGEPGCPIAANAALLEVQPDFAIWFDPRAIACMFVAGLVLCGAMSWLVGGWYPFWMLVVAVTLYGVWMASSSDDRRRLRREWRSQPREWGKPVTSRYPDFGGTYVVVPLASVLLMSFWLSLRVVFEQPHSPWVWCGLAALGPGLWLASLASRAGNVRLRLGQRAWRAGQRRQVRLRMLDGAPAFEAPRVWLRCLRRRGGARVEVEFEAVIPVGDAGRMADGDELEFVVSIPPDARPREFTEDVLRWWELVVVGRRRGRRISWIFELPVE